MTPLRKAFSELDNALPDSIFDYDLDQATVNKVWDEIEKAEQLMAKGEIADKYIKKWKK
jgi:hypothetical protein|tara:strand:+ start:419 stop:595 length:177 start_codon:yes stop_codon:yes gene_type:complete